MGTRGPAPDPNALRRDRETDQSSWRQLPESTDLPIPDLPLPRPTKRERELWEEQWRRPQAVVWREMGLERQVALFVRTLRRSEEPGSPAALTALATKQMDDLGISLDGMLRKRWRIGAMPTVQAPAPTVRTDDPDRISAKHRFQTIDGGARSA